MSKENKERDVFFYVLEFSKLFPAFSSWNQATHVTHDSSYLAGYKPRAFVYFKILLKNFFTHFVPQIKELRNLFGDDTMFVALQSNEKFPDEGFDVDVQSKLEKIWDISKTN